MEFLNIGVLELFFILLLAFIVLGPKKAVESAGQLGRWIRGIANSSFWQDIVSTSRDIRDLPRKIMDDEEIQKTIAEIERATQAANMDMVRSDTPLPPRITENGDLDEPQDDQERQPGDDTPPAC